MEFTHHPKLKKQTANNILSLTIWTAVLGSKMCERNLNYIIFLLSNSILPTTCNSHPLEQNKLHFLLSTYQTSIYIAIDAMKYIKIGKKEEQPKPPNQEIWCKSGGGNMQFYHPNNKSYGKVVNNIILT